MTDKRDDLDFAREVLSTEIRAIELVRERLGGSFSRALESILSCEGQVVVTGVGKSGIIGQKISATLASTGTPSLFLHSLEALHGDLGRIRERDMVIALSFSGETDEVVRLVPLLRRIGVSLVAVTGNPESRLGREADIVLSLGPVDEACPLGLAPTSSTTATLALGDALALGASRRRKFTREEYALFHRGGALGRQLLRVAEIMRRVDHLPLVPPGLSVRTALCRVSEVGGPRASAVLIVGDAGDLVGIFTDGDLRRRIEDGDDFLDAPIEEVMTSGPKTVRADMLVAEAQKLMKMHRIDEVPVVDKDGRPVGILDVQELLEVGFAL